MIRKVLVANRGEIAIRVMRSCREMGINSVAIFSEADRTSMHVRYADEAYYIGPSPSVESYLVIDKVIDIAHKCKADAIHPGYGFLSENPEFSKRCKKEKLIFIGPQEYAINTMGDKLTARRTMSKAGVPVIPGTQEPIRDINKAVSIVKGIGLPVMIKATAGGGGKGMRLVEKESDIKSAYKAAQSEARDAFGNDAVYVEKYIESPHHIEFQILADKFGNTIHLFERECSIQRRHQKVVEETPSPLMNPAIREEMGQKAIEAARAVNYEGAGTVEFIVDDDLNYYFLEMNTRLQVEHPITERITGIDLVKQQIEIAAGKRLSIKQNELRQHGHAIEMRIYAEDPDRNFMPSPGKIKHLSEPLGFGVRHDGYVYEGYEIPLFYDPLISKLIVWGNDRMEAIARLKRALYAYKITGIKTTIKFLERILNVPDFVSGKYNTHFIEKNKKYLMTSEKSKGNFKEMALIATAFDYLNKTEKTKSKSVYDSNRSNWKDFGRIRSVRRSIH